eukprot:4076530-Pleurochrysis_carterae.AAC.2
MRRILDSPWTETSWHAGVAARRFGLCNVCPFAWCRVMARTCCPRICVEHGATRTAGDYAALTKSRCRMERRRGQVARCAERLNALC